MTDLYKMNAVEMLDHLAGFAKHIFANTSDHEVMPMWVLAGEKDIVPIMAPFENDEQKNLAIKFVKNKAKEIEATVAGFMCEAWVVEGNKELKLDVAPSQHEDRREIIQIMAEDKHGGAAMGMYYILRPEFGEPKLSEFKVYTVTPDSLITGRFTSILEKVVH